MKIKKHFRKLTLITSGLFKIFLFLSSYIPLFIILLLQYHENKFILFITIFIIILPILTLYKYIRNALDEETNNTIVIDKVYRKGSDSMNYIAGYIIPFLSLNSDIINNNKINTVNLLSIFILFFVLGNIYISNHLYYINPVLNLLYNIDEIEDNNGDIIFLISSKEYNIKPGNIISVRNLSENIYLYK